MRRYKVVTAPPFDGKPTWHGLYYSNGQWHEVRNQHGNCIAYASSQAAMVQAKRLAEESRSPKAEA